MASRHSTPSETSQGGGIFEEGKDAVGAYVEDSRSGESGPPDFGKFLQGVGSSDPTVQCGVLVDMHLDQEDLGWVTPQGGPPAGKNQPNRTGKGRCIYPSLDKATKAVVLEGLETYIFQRQNTAALHIVTCLILQICLEAETRPGALVLMICW